MALYKKEPHLITQFNINRLQGLFANSVPLVFKTYFYHINLCNISYLSLLYLNTLMKSNKPKLFG